MDMFRKSNLVFIPSNTMDLKVTKSRPLKGSNSTPLGLENILTMADSPQLKSNKWQKVKY